jgi:hypothetical protein
VGAEELIRKLSRQTRKPVVLTITDNRCSMVYVSPGADGTVKVRLHHMFLLAPPGILLELARFIRRPTQRCRQRLSGWVRQNRHLIGGPPRGRAHLNLAHRGFHVNLKDVFDRLNGLYFGGRLQVSITWGRSQGRQRRTSIDFGSYDAEQRMIRINPALDRPWVPRPFVDSIVYHEMLHASLGVRSLGNGRREIHSVRFREEEKEFRFHRWAERWERANLWRFLRAT